MREMWRLVTRMFVWGLLGTGTLDTNGQAVFSRSRPAGRPLCTLKIPKDNQVLTCDTGSLVDGRWYGLRVVARPGGPASMAVHLKEEPERTDPIAIGGVRWETGGDCRSYPSREASPHALLATALALDVINPGDLQGTVTVEDYGTEPLSNYRIVAVVHDRILDLFSLATQTVRIPAPPLTGKICFS